MSGEGATAADEVVEAAGQLVELLENLSEVQKLLEVRSPASRSFSVARTLRPERKWTPIAVERTAERASAQACAAGPGLGGLSPVFTKTRRRPPRDPQADPENAELTALRDEIVSNVEDLKKLVETAADATAAPAGSPAGADDRGTAEPGEDAGAAAVAGPSLPPGSSAGAGQRAVRPHSGAEGNKGIHPRSMCASTPKPPATMRWSSVCAHHGRRARCAGCAIRLALMVFLSLDELHSRCCSAQILGRGARLCGSRKEAKDPRTLPGARLGSWESRVMAQTASCQRRGGIASSLGFTETLLEALRSLSDLADDLATSDSWQRREGLYRLQELRCAFKNWRFDCKALSSPRNRLQLERDRRSGARLVFIRLISPAQRRPGR